MILWDRKGWMRVAIGYGIFFLFRSIGPRNLQSFLLSVEEFNKEWARNSSGRVGWQMEWRLSMLCMGTLLRTDPLLVIISLFVNGGRWNI